MGDIGVAMTDSQTLEAVSIVFAAGRGTRMHGYTGNKTLLPLIPGRSAHEGDHPLLLEVLANLPPGPVGIVVNHCAEDVQRATRDFSVAYIPQPITNGTGGALLAARRFLEEATPEAVIITMGDVPLIRRATYVRLLRMLDGEKLAILAFQPRNRAQYGMLEMDGERVLRIVEWKYWHTYSAEEQGGLKFCNAGVYAAKRSVLIDYLDHLAGHPHHVRKQQGDGWVDIEEYFLTDLVELMAGDGLSIGWVTVPEEEVTGVDTPEALREVQKRYRINKGLCA
jgi:bifunctional N-acetylglucosamine-1-phosphate-uridyltransferase/glucosamine-1-phosphate-acetyltransferase GlmU-like protein